MLVLVNNRKSLVQCYFYRTPGFIADFFFFKQKTAYEIVM